MKICIDTRDWWIGLYRGPHHTYICPLPCVVIQIPLPTREEDTMRARLARHLRRTADRIDHRGAPKLINWWFTIEPGRGIVFRDDGHGCRLAYLSDEEYEKACNEADGKAQT